MMSTTQEFSSGKAWSEKKEAPGGEHVGQIFNLLIEDEGGALWEEWRLVSATRTTSGSTRCREVGSTGTLSIANVDQSYASTYEQK